MMDAGPVRRPRRLALIGEWLAALSIAAVAFFLFINGSFFSTYSSLDIDLSINFTASHALRDGQDPYGSNVLLKRAKALGAPANLLYSQLFTSYIQPPTSAQSLTPLTFFSWRTGTRLFVLISNVFLVAAVALTLYTVRPTLPTRWVIAGAALILMAYSQIYASLALGQWDATLCLLIAIGFWAYTRGRPGIAGVSIACAAAIKLIPGLLLVYFLWKREYRIVLWGVGAGLALLLISFAFAGYDVYHTYLTQTLPALSKGSSHYSNVSFGALLARMHAPETMLGIPRLLYLGELPSHPLATLESVLLLLTGVTAIGVIARPDSARAPEERIFEYYFAVAVALMVSSVTWEFYVVWLLPLFVAAFLAPGRVLPAGGSRWLALGGLAIAFVALNYPGDLYFFDVNRFFYHPQWVPGVWAEDRLHLYHSRLDLVPYLRLASLIFLSSCLAALSLRRREKEPHEAHEAVLTGPTEPASA